jgi:hypothetical protein
MLPQCIKNVSVVCWYRLLKGVTVLKKNKRQNPYCRKGHYMLFIELIKSFVKVNRVKDDYNTTNW